MKRKREEIEIGMFSISQVYGHKTKFNVFILSLFYYALHLIHQAHPSGR
jgi:hypothetical protein